MAQNPSEMVFCGFSIHKQPRNGHPQKTTPLWGCLKIEEPAHQPGKECAWLSFGSPLENSRKGTREKNLVPDNWFIISSQAPLKSHTHASVVGGHNCGNVVSSGHVPCDWPRKSSEKVMKGSCRRQGFVSE